MPSVPPRPIRSSTPGAWSPAKTATEGLTERGSEVGLTSGTPVAASGASEIGHQKIGQMLSGCPHDPDGSWPCKPVRDAIERMDSKDLEIGLGTGVLNSRGVVSKDPSEGGASERALAERYEGYATAVRASTRTRPEPCAESGNRIDGTGRGRIFGWRCGRSCSLWICGNISALNGGGPASPSRQTTHACSPNDTTKLRILASGFGRVVQET